VNEFKKFASVVRANLAHLKTRVSQLVFAMSLGAGDKSSDDPVKIVVGADPKPVSGVAADSR
jgi:hypothetical protein